MMRSVELFSGTGGLAKGLELSGFNHLAFVEFNKDACASLRQNFLPELVFEGDIRSFDFSAISDVDIVAGGPPCQPFSLGGKHKSSDDARDMFPYAIHAIEKLKPKAFIFENVKGLLRPSFADYFEYILARLRYPEVAVTADNDWRSHLSVLRTMGPEYFQGVKYDVSYKLINAADYGVPQTRERVVIVGVRSDLGVKWNFPTPTHFEDKLIWDQYISGEYWKRHGVRNGQTIPTSEFMRNRIERVHSSYGVFAPDGLAWQTTRDALADVPDPAEKHRIIDHIFKDGARSYPGHTGSDLDWPSKTIKAGGHGVPGGENMIRFPDDSIRYLTVYEAKLLQTFPKEFVITGPWGEAMRQIGNAVPVLLGSILGRKLYSLISREVIPTSVAGCPILRVNSKGWDTTNPNWNLVHREQIS
jgi:DNA (cytosine-5)-methyltransferase 1